MSRCDILPTARSDLHRIHNYIAEYSPANAIRFVQRLEDRCYLLAENPYIGIARLDLGENCRSFVVPGTGYIIVYQPLQNGVEIIHVRHGSQNLRRLFQQ